uniref:Autophagy-related protein 101 n=1 Tax=Mantoniella antarctica TaxID=81844 RepID=A0A7S0X740_9CHLO|mmetsp:Transcript_43473/g.69966  ORF Transcript_43473/g.69966 Transcript_43473/m.69966 type:complete len:219 (-) Transcript_43473:618-1274(-)
MNCEVFSLSPLRCEPFQVKEVLRAVLHTVLFSRTLGVVRPRDVDSELFDLTYATCGDPRVERSVEDRLDALIVWLQKQQQQQQQQQQQNGGTPKPANAELQAQVCLSFYEKRDKGGWFGRQEERLYWEQWRVPLEIFAGETVGMAEREQKSMELQDMLQGAMQHVVGLVNERKDHIPPVVSADVVSFPYEITLPGETESTFGTLKRMMLHSTPPSMLT